MTALLCSWKEPRLVLSRFAVFACVATLTVPVVAHARQEASAPPTVPTASPAATLELTLDTGATKTSSRPTPIAPAPKKNSGPSRSASGRLPGLPLPSRGAAGRAPLRRQGAAAPSVLARLGLVTTERVALRAGREANARLFSEVPKGTHLAVVAEAGQHYGVLMANNTLGWVPKDAIELLDYQTEVAAPTDPTSGQPETGAAQNASDYLNGLPADMDARTVALLQESFTYLGVPYVWAGNTRSGLDCSAFVKNVYATQGIKLPRHSGDQAHLGVAVSGSDLRAGDRLYFDMKRVGQVSHTGIYLGNGMFIHASSNQGKVGVDSLLKPNYYRALVAARRDP